MVPDIVPTTAAEPEGPYFVPAQDPRVIALERGNGVPGRFLTSLATKTKDVAYGVSAVAQILDQMQVDRDSEGCRPLLTDYHAGALLRLSIAALDLLGAECEQTIAIAAERHGQFEQGADHAQA